MNSRVIAIVTAVAAATVLCCVGGTAFLAGSTAATCTAPITVPTDATPHPVGTWDAEQVGNAITIAAVGAQKGVPARGVLIALATAMQESSLRNLPGGDRDSIGLFQQRPSQGWGTPAQLHDPAYAAGTFYDALLAVDGWQTMTVTQAAQRVQRSAYPDAYARWEEPARTLLTQVVSGPDRAASAYLEQCLSSGAWVAPVRGPIVSGFRTAERPHHQGIDIAAPKGTTIRAASAGVVITVTCNAVLDGAPVSCDTDGSPDVSGCGWYVEILHPGNVITRYCHQLTHPTVTVGQHVATGQPIGVVGTSGNSSGPHLHLEIHIGPPPATSATAVDPAVFLRSRGVTI